MTKKIALKMRNDSNNCQNKKYFWKNHYDETAANDCNIRFALLKTCFWENIEFNVDYDVL